VSERPPAVLLGARGPALSVARTLGAAGVAVDVLAGAPGAVAKSRHCRRYVAASGPDVQARWLRWLEREGPRGAVLLPCQDDGVELVARHRAELVELGYRPIEGDDDVMLAMLDKEATYERARAVGVPTPSTVRIRGAADVPVAVERVGFPCAVKPVHSHLWQRHFRAKLVVAGDEASLRACLARAGALGLEVIVTEIVPGADDQFVSYYSYLDEAGRPLFHFTKRKLRGYPIHFGLWTYQVVEWHPDVAELGLRFFSGIGLRGVGNVEFKRDARDGRLKLIECNHRFTAANELVRRAGVDIARLAYGRGAGVELAAVRPVREGMRHWSPWDIAGFLAYRAAGELSTAAWLASLRPAHVGALRWDDPMPSVAAARAGLRRLRRAEAPAGLAASLRRAAHAS
jgi:D-aspartate ligase